MVVFRSRRTLRRASGMFALITGLASFTACAEIEVGAEAAKRISRASGEGGSAAAKNASEAGDIQLAQATGEQAEDLPISPYLKPAPQLFEATGEAVWDGKRTLQGVWVAHPLAESARRVRIFNEENGRAVDGALFKRDTTADDVSSVLISSEAAQLLGMGVGTPAPIRIVAVSPVQRPPQPEAPTEAVVAETQPADTGTTDGGAAEVAESAASAAIATTAIAAAATDVASDDTTTDTDSATVEEAGDKVAEAAPQTSAGESAETIAADVRESVAVEPTEIAAPQAEAEAKEVTPEVAVNNPVAEPTETALAPVTEPEAPAKPEPKPEPVKAEPEPAKSEPAKPEPEPKTFKLETPTVAATEPAKTAAPSKPAASQGTSKLKLPYVQAGIFGVKSNATKLIRRIEAKDLPAFGREIKSGGKTLTKVLAGPFQTSGERDAALRTIRALGLKDAAPVRR